MLITPEPLDQEDRKAWASAVQDHAPAGTISSHQITVNGKTKDSSFYVKKYQEQGAYIVPLTRDLSDDEAGRIAIAWSRLYPEGDFEVHFTQSEKLGEQKRSAQASAVAQLAEDLARRWHTRWLSEQTDQRWSYGTSYDAKQRRNPRMMPWEQLADGYKQQEIKRMQAMFEIMEELQLKVSRG
jgi:RyR domain